MGVRPLVVLPSEQVLGRGIDPFTAEPPTAPCRPVTITIPGDAPKVIDYFALRAYQPAALQ